MKNNPPSPRRKHRGLTLMEAVIAIGIVAVAVPLILAATSAASKSRINSEADTRAAWIAKETQRQLIDAWRGLPDTYFATKPAFPAFSSETEPLVLLFNQSAGLIGPGNAEVYASGSSDPEAFYMVAMRGEAAIPSTADLADNSLSKVFISVEHSAKSPRSKRTSNPFLVLIPRQTAP
jgi:type II secretory pathway pseudopilin PulG